MLNYNKAKIVKLKIIVETINTTMGKIMLRRKEVFFSVTIGIQIPESS